LYSWLSLELESTIDLLPVISKNNPILVAKKIKILYAKYNSTKHTGIISAWLNANFFPAKCKNFFIYEGQEIHFSLEVLDYNHHDQIYRFVTNESFFEESINETELFSSQIGGIEVQFEEICRLVNLFLKPEKYFDGHNIKLPHGILLYGPPGCGKTLLVKTISDFINVPVINLTASDFASEGHGEAELKLKHIFDSAKRLGSCILFMDEIDSLCPKRDLTSSTSSQRMTTLLLTFMDGYSGHKSASRIFFIGATNMPASLDPALRRPGRFDREIEIPPPSSIDRLSILKKFLEKYPNSLTENDLKLVADLSHGYVGSDINLLCKEAFMNSIKTSDDSSPVIRIEDIQISLSKIRPSAMREVFIEVPKVKWSDIGGQGLTKQKLIECVEWPIKVISNT
jgi:AAA family ATPase